MDRPVPHQGPAALPLPRARRAARPSATCPRRPCARWWATTAWTRSSPSAARRSRSQAKEELQRLCDLYGIGIEVQQLVLQDVNPPDPVKPAFNEVNQAIQEKERAINDAWADYNKAVPRAKGEAEQAVRAAEGYALERVNNAEGDAKRFEALYEEYRKAPAVTRKRIYLETHGARSCPRSGRSWSSTTRRRGILPLLQLDGETGGGEASEAARSPLIAAAAVAAAPAAPPSTPSPRPSRRSSPSSASPVGGLVTDAGPALQGAVRPGRAPLRQALAGVRRRRQRDPHQRQEVHLGRHLRALAHRRPAALLPGRARRARRRRAASTTSSTARRATPSPPSTSSRSCARSNRAFQVTEELAGHRLRRGHGQGRRTGREQDRADHPGEGRARSRPSSASSWWTCASSASTTWTRVQQKVFERMISERKRIAERSRSEGQGRAAEIRGQKERDMLARQLGRLQDARRR